MNSKGKTGDPIVDSLFSVQRLNQVTTAIKFSFVVTLIILYQGRHVDPLLLSLLPIIGTVVALISTYFSQIASKKINKKGTWRIAEITVALVDILVFGPVVILTIFYPSMIIVATIALSVFYPLAKAFSEFDSRMIKQNYFAPIQIHEWETMTQRLERIFSLSVSVIVFIIFKICLEKDALVLCTIGFTIFNIIDIVMSFVLVGRLNKLYANKGESIVDI